MDKKPKRPRDLNQLAKTVVDIATAEHSGSAVPENSKSNAASVLGKLGGQARAKALSPQRRKEISKKARAARRASTDV
jgi:hypothetical protein